MGQTQNIEQQIELLSNLRLGFGIAALLFLALAVFLFFYLHIPQVFNEYRGKSAQKAMEAMAANSSESGRIVVNDKKSKGKKKGTGENIQRRHYTDNLTDDLSERISQEISEPTGSMNQGTMAAGEQATDVLQEAAMGSEATDVLEQSMLDGSEATDVLEQSMLDGSEATDVLDPFIKNNAETSGVSDNLEPCDSDATDVLTEEMLQEGGMAATDILDPAMLQKEAPERQHISTPDLEGTMVLDPAMLSKSENVFEIERSIILIHTKKVI